MNDSISGYMTDDHRRCDHLLAACEAGVSARSWPALEEAADGLGSALERHFKLEEEVLFPELEQVDARSRGPVGVMRMEHAQMRKMISELATAARERDSDRCFGILETLHMFIQQHNTKEEGVLYPLADGALTAQAPSILVRMREC
ncbi:MAG: hemerythrin domain-containing protein [Chromatiaceae bacterium]|nr:hemerythrin domain-containing protein [Chromatiaceae bacterium]